MYLIPPTFSCCVNCEHESRSLIKPHCAGLLSVLNFTPSINKAIIFLCTQSKGGKLHTFSLVTIVYEGRFKDLLCIFWLIHFQSPMSLLSLGDERRLFLFLRTVSNCEGIVFWARTWNGLSPRLLMHTFVGFNLQIVVAGPMWVLCNANPSEEHKQGNSQDWVCGRAYPSVCCQF